MNIDDLIDKLITIRVVKTEPKITIAPDYMNKLSKELIGAIEYFTDFITCTKDKKLYKKIWTICKYKFTNQTDVPVCLYCKTNQVNLMAGVNRNEVSTFCSHKCSNTFKNKNNANRMINGKKKSTLICEKAYKTKLKIICETTGKTLAQKALDAAHDKLSQVIDGETLYCKFAKQETERRKTELIDGIPLKNIIANKSAETNRAAGNYTRLGELARDPDVIKKRVATLKETLSTPEGIIIKNNRNKAARNARLRINSVKDFSDPDVKRMYRIYKRRVRYHTEQVAHLLPNFDKRGNHFYDKNAWHVDHKYPVALGFENNIPPYIIGSIHNIEMLPWQENIKKQAIPSLSKDDLFESFFSEHH